jgi:hypothetical protein
MTWMKLPEESSRHLQVDHVLKPNNQLPGHDRAVNRPTKSATPAAMRICATIFKLLLKGFYFAKDQHRNPVDQEDDLP